MHIPDGFVSDPVAIVGAATSVAVIGYAVVRCGRDLDERRVPLVGATAAFIFAMQMLNFPVAGGTSGHFLGAALAAILLGPWLGAVVMAVVLVVQALVFADGGVTALGVAILNMAVIATLVVGVLSRLVRAVVPPTRAGLLGVAAAGAWLSVMAAALATAVELGMSGTVPYGTVLPAMLGVHAVIGVGEAMITVAALSTVLATRPDLIDGGDRVQAGGQAAVAR